MKGSKITIIVLCGVFTLVATILPIPNLVIDLQAIALLQITSFADPNL
jgi:hypothetical protein